MRLGEAQRRQGTPRVPDLLLSTSQGDQSIEVVAADRQRSGIQRHGRVRNPSVADPFEQLAAEVLEVAHNRVRGGHHAVCQTVEPQIGPQPDQVVRRDRAGHVHWPSLTRGAQQVKDDEVLSKELPGEPEGQRVRRHGRGREPRARGRPHRNRDCRVSEDHRSRQLASLKQPREPRDMPAQLPDVPVGVHQREVDDRHVGPHVFHELEIPQREGVVVPVREQDGPRRERFEHIPAVRLGEANAREVAGTEVGPPSAQGHEGEEHAEAWHEREAHPARRARREPQDRRPAHGHQRDE